MAVSGLTPRHARRTTDEVYRILRGRIIDGTLPAGSRVDIEALVTELDVSRTPIREAVLQLATAGLVERQPYRGTVVTGVDPNRLEEVTALRVLLESMATELAVLRLTEENLDVMERALNEIDQREQDPLFSNEDFNELNHVFHSTLYAAADSPVLIRLIEQLNLEADRMRIHYPIQRGHSRVDHRVILSAARARDVHAAGEAMRAHIRNAHAAKSANAVTPLSGDSVAALVARMMQSEKRQA